MENLVVHSEEDAYGYYSTGAFYYKGKVILVNIVDGRWNAFVSAKHPIGDHEMNIVRRYFIPDRYTVLKLVPSLSQASKSKPNTYVLFANESIEEGKK